MPDDPDLQARLLDLLGRIEIDDTVELTVRAGGDEAVDILRAIARGDVEAEAYERSNAVYLLGLIDADGSIADLDRILEQEDIPRLRLETLHTLARAGGETARHALLNVAGADKSDMTERVYAVGLLTDIGEPEDIEKLRDIEPRPEDVPLAEHLADTIRAIEARSPDPRQKRPDDPHDDECDPAP